MAWKALAAGEGAGPRPPTAKLLTLASAMAGTLPASVRGTCEPRARARKAVCAPGCGAGLQPAGAVEPAVFSALDAGRAGFHEVLRVEVGAGHVGRAGGVDDGEMALIVERLEGRERGMQAEEAVEIDDLILRDGDAGAHGVVVLLAIGNDDVEAVGCAALEDDDQARPGLRRGFASTERTRKLGMAAVPAMASAPLRRKNLRLVCMVPSFTI
jgi:hypothetical protein